MFTHPNPSHPSKVRAGQSLLDSDVNGGRVRKGAAEKGQNILEAPACLGHIHLTDTSMNINHVKTMVNGQKCHRLGSRLTAPNQGEIPMAACGHLPFPNTKCHLGQGKGSVLTRCTLHSPLAARRK